MSTKIGQPTPGQRGPHLALKGAIFDRIRRDKSILVWTPNDFLDLGTRSAVDKAFQRLALSGDLRRIDRGIYDVPRVNALTGKPSTPDYTAIIDAVIPPLLRRTSHFPITVRCARSRRPRTRR